MTTARGGAVPRSSRIRSTEALSDRGHAGYFASKRSKALTASETSPRRLAEVASANRSFCSARADTCAVRPPAAGFAVGGATTGESAARAAALAWKHELGQCSPAATLDSTPAWR